MEREPLDSSKSLLTREALSEFLSRDIIRGPTSSSHPEWTPTVPTKSPIEALEDSITRDNLCAEIFFTLRIIGSPKFPEYEKFSSVQIEALNALRVFKIFKEVYSSFDEGTYESSLRRTISHLTLTLSVNGLISDELSDSELEHFFYLINSLNND